MRSRYTGLPGHGHGFLGTMSRFQPTVLHYHPSLRCWTGPARIQAVSQLAHTRRRCFTCGSAGLGATVSYAKLQPEKSADWNRQIPLLWIQEAACGYLLMSGHRMEI